MNILLHTIALEPARWTPARVSRPLIELLPAIAAAGFYKLEVFEPHLALAPDEGALVEAFRATHLAPTVLSSYLDMNPATNPEETFAPQARALLARVEQFGFQKVRLFPGRGPELVQTDETADRMASRLRTLATHRLETEFLFETHDGSLADDPARVLRVLERSGCPNVGLIWQPTVFEVGAAREQFAVQRSAIRHFHLQNRTSADRITTLGAGIIPWKELLGAINFGADATIEFLPTGLVPLEQFDLTTTLQEAVQEFDYVVQMER